MIPRNCLSTVLDRLAEQGGYGAFRGSSHSDWGMHVLHISPQGVAHYAPGATLDHPAQALAGFDGVWWDAELDDARPVRVRAIVVSGALSASEAGADGFAASGSIGAADVIGNFAALESGADTISVSGVVIVSGALAATEEGSDTMQTDTGEGYPSSVTITVPAGRLLSAASGRTITLRPR